MMSFHDEYIIKCIIEELSQTTSFLKHSLFVLKMKLFFNTKFGIEFDKQIEINKYSQMINSINHLISLISQLNIDGDVKKNQNNYLMDINNQFNMNNQVNRLNQLTKQLIDYNRFNYFSITNQLIDNIYIVINLLNQYLTLLK